MDANALIEARQAMGLSKNKAAKAIGISRSYLSKLEGDGGNPSPEVIAKIEKFYGASLAPPETKASESAPVLSIVGEPRYRRVRGGRRLVN